MINAKVYRRIQGDQSVAADSKNQCFSMWKWGRPYMELKVILKRAVPYGVEAFKYPGLVNILRDYFAETSKKPDGEDRSRLQTRVLGSG